MKGSALIADVKARNAFRSAAEFAALLQSPIPLKTVKAAQRTIAQFVDVGDYSSEMQN